MLHRLLGIAFAAVVLAASPVHAATIVQAKSLDASLPAPSLIAFDAFDPALGTLTSAQISMTGVMSVQAFASPFPGEPGLFNPYSFSIVSSLNAVSPGGFGFAFGTPASWTVPFATSGIGAVVTAATPFSLGFAFGPQSDVTGFASLGGFSGFTQPPVPITGQLGDFVETLITEALGIQQQFIVPLPLVLGAPVPVTVTGAQFQGVIELTYTYASDANTVQEPGSLALLGLALFLVTASRTRGLHGKVRCEPPGTRRIPSDGRECRPCGYKVPRAGHEGWAWATAKRTVSPRRPA